MEKIKTDTAEVWLDEEGILWVKIFKDAEIDVKEVNKLFSIYRKLGCEEKKVLQILDAREGFSFASEARARSGTRTEIHHCISTFERFACRPNNFEFFQPPAKSRSTV